MNDIEYVGIVCVHPCGLDVFKDDQRIRGGELWLDRLQEAERPVHRVTFAQPFDLGRTR